MVLRNRRSRAGNVGMVEQRGKFISALDRSKLDSDKEGCEELLVGIYLQLG